MLTRINLAVLTALRDLAAENAASRPLEMIRWSGTAPTLDELAVRSKVKRGQLEDVLFELKDDGLVITIGGKPVVSIGGHRALEEHPPHATAGDAEASC